MSLQSCARPLRTIYYALISQTFCQPSPDLQVSLPDFIPLVHHRAHAFNGTKLAFHPHNSTRPPQPPAASFKPAYRKCLGSTPRSTDAFLLEAFPIKRSDLSGLCARNRVRFRLKFASHDLALKCGDWVIHSENAGTYPPATLHNDYGRVWLLKMPSRWAARTSLCSISANNTAQEESQCILYANYGNPVTLQLLR